MSHLRFGRSVFLVAALLLAACTQDPASVDYRGGKFYGREHEEALDSPNHETFPVNSPRYKEGYAHPVEQANVASVGVTDLAPPTAGSANTAPPVAAYGAPFGSPSKPIAAADVAPLAQAAAPAASTSEFIWPIAGGKVISHYGHKSDGKNNDGVNIAVAEGEPIWAAGNGTVVYAGNELKGYGNMVIIRHDNGFMTAYAHARSISVKKSDQVKQGQIIGYVGMSGGVKTPQLHFAMRKAKTPVDPEQYLPAGGLGGQ